MQQDFSALTPPQAYKLMNSLIVPRPIAWVTSMSADGVVNLAPYSTFNIVCYDPPLLGMNVGFRDDGTRKDTGRNARDRGELVIHIADDALLEKLHASSFPHPPAVSEPEVLGLALAPSVDVAVPRLRDAPLAIECRVAQVISFSAKADFVVSRIVRVHARDFVVSRIVRVHAREGLLHDHKIDTADLRPLARLAGPVYGLLGETVTMAPPTAR